jgi:hypothetical protein
LKSRATARFWKLYAALPARVQQRARKNYRLWLDDHNHPSLGFKPLKGVPESDSRSAWAITTAPSDSGSMMELSGFGSARTRITTNSRERQNRPQITQPIIADSKNKESVGIEGSENLRIKTLWPFQSFRCAPLCPPCENPAPINQRTEVLKRYLSEATSP